MTKQSTEERKSTKARIARSERTPASDSTHAFFYIIMRLELIKWVDLKNINIYNFTNRNYVV